MLQIDTSKYDKKRWHDIEVGGHHFKFRELGAGEMLQYTQKAERAMTLSGKDKLSDTQSKELANIAKDLIKQALEMFKDPSNKGKVDKIVGQYDALSLFNIVNDIRRQLKDGQDS